jgi:CheY-like chemotaxis protein
MSKDGPILIVEDDLDDCDILREVIEGLGIRNELKFFQNGRLILSYLQTTKDQPFIILSDVNMPLMSGPELKREINNDPYLREKSIPFVFFSTNASPAAVQEAYEMMVQGFFKKESSLEKIREVIKLVYDYWTVCRHPNSEK